MIILHTIPVSPVKLIFWTQVHESLEKLWSDVDCCLGIILAKAMSYKYEKTKYLINFSLKLHINA